jgi:Sec-independent protein secretion pathway component TatC
MWFISIPMLLLYSLGILIIKIKVPKEETSIRT